MSDINQNVNINVNANTSNASKDVEKLERNIATLDGAINVVGGSVEVLAGSLALTGAVTEEQAERFESAAVGAIALADGSKRIIEGYRTLATQTKVVTVVQKAFNAVLKANPIGLLITGLALLTAGIVAYVSATDKATEAADREREALIKLNEERLNSLSRNIALAKAQGASIEELAALRKEELETELKLVTAQRQRLQNEGGISKGVRKNREEIEKTGQEQLRIKNELKILEIETANAIENRDKTLKEASDRAAEAARKQAEEARNARLEYEGLMQTIQQTTEEVVESLNILNANNPLDGPLEQIEEFEEELEDMVFFTAEQIAAFNEATAINEDDSFEARRARLEAYYDDLIQQAESNSHQVQQLEKAKNKALGQLDDEELQRKRAYQQQLSDLAVDSALGTLSALSDLNSIFDSENEEAAKKAFQREKALSIAETVISTYASAQKAFASQLIPGDPTSIIRAQIAAGVAVAGGLARLAVISAQKFESSGSAGGGGGAAAGAGGVPSAGGGQQVTGVPAIPGAQYGDSGVTTLNAVVLSGEMTSAQAQDTAIRNRRRFGG